MQAKKFKRKFYKSIPILFISTIIILLFTVGIYSLSNVFLSKQNSFLSPLAKRISNNSNIESQLTKNNIQFSKVEGGTVTLKGGGVVYLNLDKNVSSQISSLQLILTRLTIEGKKFKKLDLRFDKPIIEF